MNETTERPELGTTEAAVRACVNMISLVTHTNEDQLAYWLDCYYQLRAAHEKEMTPPSSDDLFIKVEAPDPVIVRLDELEARIRELEVEPSRLRHSVVPPTPPDHYPPAPPRPGGKTKKEPGEGPEEAPPEEPTGSKKNTRL